MTRVLLTDYAWPDLSLEGRTLAEAGAELIVADSSDEARLVELAADVDAIMTCWSRVMRPVIEAAPRCRIIARLGIGLDNIDVAAATERGIIVTNVPDYCRVEVAEHALALLLALARNVALYHHEAKQGRYELNAGPPLMRLEGRTLGIVGLGSIGGCLAEKAAALGMRVIGTSRSAPLALPRGVEWTTLEELLAQSDFVSLHLPATSETVGLMNAQRLAKMKRGAMLINTARGALVDEAALTAALEAGRLAGAALDVQATEPPDLAQPPFNLPQVIVTPHAAFVSRESLMELRQRASTQVADCLAGRTPRDVVNPAVLRK